MPRDAATIMLVRDGRSGLEVFMLRRNLASVFVAGAYVFPGGAVDDADRHADLESLCAGRTDEDASALLGVERGGLAYWVAAVRECFEEAGVLLARPRDIAAQLQSYRDAIYSGELRLVDLCRRHGLLLDADQIHYFSHWITPIGAPRRYDTRFFVAAAPPEQTPRHDDAETIAHLWIRPIEALERCEAGEIDLIFPTVKSLEAIGQFDRSRELLAAVGAAEAIPERHPRLAKGASNSEEAGVRILLPGEAGFPSDGAGFPSEGAAAGG